jgi:RimJ/RimL family protein N-acetyltransferase
VARALADYAFTLGVQRVGARVVVGNAASDRVLERAGFTREDVIRSTSGVEKTVYSLRRPA